MKQTETAQRLKSEIIPPELAVRAMRDSGYRNTAYALAELIDNSVQAKASSVDVICLEEYELINERERRRMRAIGVLDNGEGMTPDVLGLALQFGNGTHLTDRSGIGRFGMGLPNSSISQCRRVEVWTWQNGPDNAYYSYLDVDEIEDRSLYAVPFPVVQALPKEWWERSDIVDTTGTLVLWTKFDEHRLTWRGARATLRHTETLVGRMYRKFIDDGRLAIRLLALESDKRTLNQYVRVNDPLYLMKNSSTDAPFDKEPMFQGWGNEDEVFTINYGQAVHNVIVRMSWARPETVPKDLSDRGAKPYGKHAAKNLGVSIVRAGRELDLDTGWTNSYDPTERWWGIEVEFPPALDEVFGVTNSKQNATIFSQMAQFDWHAEANPDESRLSEFKERIQSEGDPRALLLPIIDHIRQQIPQMRKRLKDQNKGRRTKDERYDKPEMADLATTKFRKRAEQGHETVHDKEDFREEDRKKFEEDLKEDKHYSDNVAQKIANATLTRKRKVAFLTKAMEGYAFFNVEHKQGGLTAIVFNTNHPFYEQLIESLDPTIGEETDSELLDRVHTAANTLELLFAAWARYEMEEVQQQNRLFEMRQEWGKMARFFLTEDDE